MPGRIVLPVPHTSGVGYMFLFEELSLMSPSRLISISYHKEESLFM